MSGRILEIACFNADAALQAQQAGAHRVELCSNYCVGGVTPDTDSLKRVIATLHIPVFAIVRPREGNFIYTQPEKQQMLEDIAAFATMGVHGLVTGALTPDLLVDLSFCRQALRAAGGLPLTFHRAIDHCPDIALEVEKLAEIGFARVLTSGGAASAQKGLECLARLHARFAKQLRIVPGGGVRASNLAEIVQRTGCMEFHSAATKAGSELPSEKEVQAMLQILERA